MRSARRRTPARLAPLPAMLAAAGLLQSLGATPAAAACAPTLAPASGQSVQCDGAVVNQSVEAAAGSQNVTITVAPGALFSTNATRALSVDDRSRIVNEGTIQMAGGAGASRGAMVGFGDNNQLINRGSITTSGSGVRGISVPNVGSTGTLVDNSGSIRTQGASAHGIAINGPGNRVQNSGAITVNGTDAKGVYLQGGSPAANVLVNGGTIHARGASSNGIFGPDGVHVNTTNANGFHARVENLPGGRILSDHSYALRGQNGNDTFINAGYLQGHGGAGRDTAVYMGPQGTGTLILRTGSAIAGLADGGGAASHAYLEGSGTVDNRFANFRTLTMRGADWRWTSDAAFTESVDLRTGTFFLAGTLASPANRLAAGAVLAGTGTLAGALRNAGEIRPGPNDGSGYGALTVRGDYTGAGGALRVNTVLAGDGAASDRLVIDGGHAGGSTPVTVVNRGGQGALTAADGILVVQAINGASSDAGAFSLAAPLNAGAYEYRLYRGDATGAAPDSWYLRSRAYLVEDQLAGSLAEAEAIADDIGRRTGERPSIEDTPLYRPEVALYSSIPMLARRMGLAQLGTFHERQGNQALLARDGERVAAWARAYGGNSKQALDGDAQPGIDARLAGVQLGQDLYSSVRPDGGQHRFGLFGGYGHARGDTHGSAGGERDAATGRLTIDGYSVGGYWTYVGPRGWYVDTVLANTWMDIDTDSKAGRDADTRGQALTASLESGYPLALSERWTLEPQAQLIYQHTRVDDFSDAVSEVRIRDDNALTARLGARLQGEYAAAAQVWRPYAALNFWRTFSGENTVVLGEDSIDTRRGATSLELAAGASVTLARSLALYGRLAYATSIDSQYLRGASAQLGMRYTW
ncbi:BP1344/BB2830 family autotransporter [Bordetella bronchiseptica]|uniref:BP1344/BB2830 family autotransporter n=1 Tax=Bordetella bronchiseptica TaxID=518 RepID=UPI000528504C|nr:BP1344/BB2830 family autotransporter [Bordetella bronchiseptica]VEF42386.1 Outer membrane protein IcsA autotransporter precursor [Bordetella bronchiseptica]